MDGQGRIAVPGFIDTHVHVKSCFAASCKGAYLFR